MLSESEPSSLSGQQPPLEYRRESAGQSLTDLFEQTVRTVGERTALVGDAGSLGYDELNRLANRVSRRLAALGIGPDSRVGVRLARSLELYPVVIAILKTGACVVPLNPAHPAQFIDRIIRESAPDLVIVDDAPESSDAFGTARLGLRELIDGGAGLDDTDPPRAAGPDTTAFLLFTSGSTGEPKGVRIAHRGLARLGPDHGVLDVGPDDCLVQQAAFSFAASTIEIWLALLHGAKLVVPPPGLPSLPVLRKAVLDHGVTMLSLPCGLFNLLVDEEPDCLRGLRIVLLSGDFPSAAQLAKAAGLTSATLYNGYGCTENSSITSVHPIRSADEVRLGERVPIGRPLPGVTMAVLDEQLRPCAPGVTGQLAIGGSGLAQGYLNHPELTGRKFVSAPDGERRYLTGDLARTTEAGDIVLAGRADSMVKVRGYRVETTAVALTLRALEGIGEVVVKAFADETGQQVLVAFYTTTAGGAADGAELARRLGEQLPDYMVPSVFQHLDTMPTNVNGKIDRSALTTPAGLSGKAGKPTKGGSAMQNPLEAVVLQAWKDISGAEEFTTTDSFLGHGGNSLHFVQLAARLQKIFGVSVATEDVFRHGTVEQLTRFIEEVRAGTQDSAATAG